ncbi:MAG TPA: ATP-dependent DNA helicase [Acidimicrobiales bacterium]|nr:ATP-dependent DNA helicase [Acidimicrobiales bacterium]
MDETTTTDGPGAPASRVVVPGPDGRCARCDRWSPGRYLPERRACCEVLLCAECHNEAVRRGRCAHGSETHVAPPAEGEEAAPPHIRIDTDLVVGRLGKVVAALPGGGEARPGQVEMALAVAAAIESNRHLIVQAGTGTGKSVGYLVPALLSGRKVVVATATKALQDQLAAKDLPFLQAHLDAPFEFAVVKGRSNYFCRQRGREVAGGGDQLDLDGVDAEDLGTGFSAQVMRLLQWGAESETGERSELDFEPTPKAWAQVSVNAMECPGAARCPSGDACFAEFARERAEQADVVVANTHLYGTHLASGGHVLPDHDVVIFDEAHELEDVASSALGLELGAGRFRSLARNARGLLAPDEVVLADELEAMGDRWEVALDPWRNKRLPTELGEELGAVLVLAAERANRLVAAIRKSERDEARKGRALQAGGHLAGDLAFVAGLPSSYVSWVEGPPHAPVFKCSPVEVGPLLSEKLWGDVVAVLTSATIPPHLPARIGIETGAVTELDVGSPFDYPNNALLYCALALPDPRTPAYEAAMHDELERLMRAAGGRTLALFTSWRAMTAAAEALSPRVPWRVLTQSDLPKPALIKAFTDDHTSCLFATMGFWQGVDVPGEALSLVTIDRIPFPRPDEPLLQARRERAGAAAFRVIDLPRAATLLAQGTGRLIRSATDRGVVAILDPRLGKAGYRWDLVRALPPMKRTRDRADVEAFLAPLRP